MESKRTIWLGALLGGWVGGFIPLLWGADYFSFSSLLFNALGGMAGIYLAFRLTH